MAVTEYLDLKLLAQSVFPYEPKLELNIEALLKREEFLKNTDNNKEKKSDNEKVQLN